MLKPHPFLGPAACLPSQQALLDSPDPGLQLHPLAPPTPEHSAQLGCTLDRSFLIKQLTECCVQNLMQYCWMKSSSKYPIVSYNNSILNVYYVSDTNLCTLYSRPHYKINVNIIIILLVDKLRQGEAIECLRSHS